MSDDEDAEDRQLREATERDPSRSREMPKWMPPKITGQVPCRARCGSLVDWTEEAEHSFVVFCNRLTSQNESALDKTRIVFCPACVAKGRALRSDENRKHVDALAEKIRALKDASGSEERELIEQIKKLHHPDLPGLLSALAERRSKGRRVRASDVL